MDRIKKFVWALPAIAVTAVAALFVAPPKATVAPPRPAANGPVLWGLDGRSVPVVDPGGKPTVLLFLSTQCPLTNRAAPNILAMQRVYGPKGVRFLAVFPNDREPNREVAASVKARRYAFPVVRDPHARVARALGADVTPEAVVVGPHEAVLYRGGVDDATDVKRSVNRFLRVALDDTLAGRETAEKGPAARGCLIAFPQQVTSTAVTYAHDVQPILRQNCETCHHAGEAAPFSLTDYDQAKSWAPMLTRVTRQHIMPPWKPQPDFGHFRNERRLTDGQITTLARWAQAGAPMGPAKSVLPPQKFPSGWRLGTPDLQLQADAPYNVAAEGRDVYRCYSVDAHLDHDAWLAGMEVKPGNRAVVHHVIVFLDRKGESKKLDDADPEPGYSSSGGGVGIGDAEMLSGWVPGNYARLFPNGMAQRVPAGSRLVIQVHYHKDGKPETDLTRIGLHWATAPVDKEIHIAPIVNWWFKLPPGNNAVPVHAEMQAPWDVHVLAVIPHMHNLGRQIQAVAEKPNGTKEKLIRISDWDFNWQDSYAFRQPLPLPKGSKVKVDTVYDNSAGNPKNPNNPPREVKWGEQTTDEMCLMYIVFTRDAEHLLGKKTALAR